MDPKQLNDFVIKPTLKKLGLHSLSSEQLVLGTVFVESNAKFVKQIGGGPALGISQMEPATHDDIHANFLKYRKTIRQRLEGITTNTVSEELVTNLAYAIAMCRIHYLRVKEPLPTANDIPAMARYWKQYYNTHLGAGEVMHFIDAFPSQVYD